MTTARQGQLLTKLTLSLLRTAWSHKVYTIQIVIFLAGGYLVQTAKTEAAYILGNHAQTAMASSLVVTAIADRRIRSAGLLEHDLRGRYDAKHEALARDKARLAEDSSKVAQARERLNREISDFEIKRDNYRDSIKLSLEKENEVTKLSLERDLKRKFDHQSQALETQYKRLEASLRKEAEAEKLKAGNAISWAQKEAEKVKRDAEVATQRANEIMAECAADKAGISSIAKQKVQEVIGIKEAEKKEFVQVLKGTNACFDDERQQVNLKFQQLAHQVALREGEIEKLELEVRRLRETRLASGGTEEAKLCRRIHRWLESQLDTTLHHLRVDFLGDGAYRFCFINQSRSLEDFQKVKGELATFISVPIEKIEQNFDESSIEITVRLARKTVIKEDDIHRLCRSDKEYLERSMHWDRVQFLAPSETGKTSSAEILGSQFIRAKSGQIYFHFPNENSIKNYVMSPIASRGTDACIESFSRLVRRVNAIQNGDEALPGHFEYHIFDDSDSVISQAIRAGLTRQEILDFFTRASHCRIGFCLIGHSTAANHFPGFTHSDFNNLVRIYAGTDIMTALQNTQIISEDRARSLKTQYEKIRDYYESKNKDLGLVTSGSSADPQAYRFALVIEPNSRPYFCQLLRLDLLSKDTSDLCNNADNLEPSASPRPALMKPNTLDEQSLKVIQSKESASPSPRPRFEPSASPRPALTPPSPQDEQSLKVFQGEESPEIGHSTAPQKNTQNRGVCPKCGGSRTKKDGKGKGKHTGEQKYRCLDPEHPKGVSRIFYLQNDG